LEFCNCTVGLDNKLYLQAESTLGKGSWNRVLKKYVPKMKELRARWRKLDNEFHDLCSSQSVIMEPRRKIWMRHMIHMGEKRKAYRVIVKRREKIF
jgi:hypothetical protein